MIKIIGIVMFLYATTLSIIILVGDTNLFDEKINKSSQPKRVPNSLRKT